MSSSDNTASQLDNHPEPFGDHVYQPVQVESEASTSEDQAQEPTMDPSIQSYLTKVQVLTPLSILLNLASLTVCSILVDPSLSKVSSEHITQFTPNPAFILAFWATLFLFQVGFALLVVLGQKDFTKVSERAERYETAANVTSSLSSLWSMESAFVSPWPTYS